MSQQINLFNPIFRIQKKYFSSVTMLQAMAIVCLACALLVADAFRRTSALTAQLRATEATVAARQARLAEVRSQFAPRARSTTLSAEIAEAQQTLEMLQNASASVARGGFGDVTGFSPYFRALARQRLDGVWLTGVDIASGGERIAVQGNTLEASLVPQFMARLAQEPVMKGKTFGALQIVAARDPAAGPDGGGPAFLKFNLQSTAGAAVPTGGAQ